MKKGLNVSAKCNDPGQSAQSVHADLDQTVLLTLSQILDSSILKEFADHNFKFDENGRKFSKQVENTVGKGEITRYEQFLLFPQCFQKTCTTDTLKPGLVWERVKEQFSACIHQGPYSQTILKNALSLVLQIFLC